MKRKYFQWRSIFLLLSLLTILACSISFNNDEGASSAEQTLQAIYAQDTVEALQAEADTQPESASDQEMEAEFIEPEHQIDPGNAGSPALTKNEIDTSKTAAEKYALGDSFRLGNFERPFTESDMDYHPETDLTKLSLAKGSDFYYFTLEVFSGSKDEDFPSSTYGVEMDTDLDGRGDILLMAEGVNSENWTVENVSVLSDSNNDVGGSQPVVPDSGGGDGYDEVLFSNEMMDDSDAAWQRVEASDKIQLAIKTSLVGASRFMWRAWADSAIADPAQFDYNDAFTETEAGSPIKNSDFYPLRELHLMDSTCWINYGNQLASNFLGGCDVIPPTPVPPTSEPAEPPCDCGGSCHRYDSDQFCCGYCGCNWYVSQEFTECAP